MNYYVQVVNEKPVAMYRDDKRILGQNYKTGKKVWIADKLESQAVTVAVDYFMAKARKKASDLPLHKHADIRHAFNVRHTPDKITPRATIPYLSKAYRLPEGEIRKILRA